VREGADMQTIDVTDYLDLFGLGELSGEVSGLFPEWDFSVEQILGQVLTGDFTGGFGLLWEQFTAGIRNNLDAYRNLAVLVLVLGILGAFYQVFASAFQNHQIADMGYFLFYLTIVGILLAAFKSIQEMAVGFLNEMVLFLELFFPTFCICVGTATGSATASSTYGLTLIFLFLVEKVVRMFLLPLVGIYVLLSLINGIWEEERLNALLDQMKNFLQAAVKWLLGSVFGVTLIRNAIGPVIDGLTGSAFQKILSSLPTIGGAANLAWQTTIGAAVLIKNSVGVVCMLLLLLLAAMPLCAILVFTALLKVDAVLLGLLEENRIVHCVQRLGDGGMLLLKILFGAMAMFLLFIALTIMTTNRGF